MQGISIPRGEPPGAGLRLRHGKPKLHGNEVLMAEVHPTKNDLARCRELTQGSAQKLTWLCALKHEWVASVFQRTSRNSGCPRCAVSKRTKHQAKRNAVISARSGNKILVQRLKSGDDMERYVENLLRTIPSVTKVTRLGQYGGQSDIAVKFAEGPSVQLQVKTLVHMDTRVRFDIRNRYPEDMLIIAVNKERTRFVHCFQKDVKTGPTVFTFTKCKNQRIMLFDHVDTFKSSLAQAARHSTAFAGIEATLSRNIRKEYLMTIALEAAANERGLPFQRNEDNTNEVDGLLGGHPVQLKFTSVVPKTAHTFQVSAFRHGGVLTGKSSVNVPYDISAAFDFLVVQLGTSDGDARYPGQFCIIPKAVLAERGILSDPVKQITGRVSIGVAAPDHKGYPHWTSQYWDRWDLISRKRKALKTQVSGSAKRPRLDSA